MLSWDIRIRLTNLLVAFIVPLHRFSTWIRRNSSNIFLNTQNSTFLKIMYNKQSINFSKMLMMMINKREMNFANNDEG